MEYAFAQRMASAHRSFIREILKVTAEPDVISFAGGLPNPELFPFRGAARAASVVLGSAWGPEPPSPPVLQYSTTEGFPGLRQWIAARYKSKGLTVDAEDILITTGSQQGLDLLAKVFLDAGDPVVIERPGYLGAIQAFSLFEPVFRGVELQDDGPDLEQLARALDGTGEQGGPAKLFYAVTNFQNPSGLTYSKAKREAVAQLLKERSAIFVEDDPYGELRFSGEPLQPLCAPVMERSILLGSFSKVAAPGFRVGWLVAPPEIREKLVIAKQAADLHTSTLTQRILFQYLEENHIDDHIELIRERYGKQRDVMVAAMEEHLPRSVSFTRPEGGMFLWATLPPGISSLELFDKAIACKVAFVPGTPFYPANAQGEPQGGRDTLRLNFSNTDEERIKVGIARLGECFSSLGAA
ncbi:MAG: PLP-dependent aminotransferase family protein [Desulfovibrio sp.]|nr:MAG: PLP-dependent aminotransferase family protein [Desulfovibrio sp.]